MVQVQFKDEIDAGHEFADELAPGAKLMHGQYTIDGFLNAGGFGITYVARDSLDRSVVIKECFPGAFCRRSKAMVNARSRAHTQELASIVELFVQEAHNLSRLDHPNVVGVHSVFEENNTAYMTLDHIEGRDLLSYIEGKDTSLKPEQVEMILRRLLDAIGYIHDLGMLHRDIAPDNILLQADLNPILIDFGAAREEASKQSRALSALRVVKDGYSPQEFYISGSLQGPFSDLYALGATFYQLITGALPPSSQVRLSAVAAGEPDPYEPLVGRGLTYRNAFLKAIDASLEVLPNDRIASAAAWLEMLDGGTNILSLHRKQTPVRSKQATETAPKRTSKVGILLATAAVIGGVAFYLGQDQLGLAPTAEPMAVAEAATGENPASDLAVLTDKTVGDAIPVVATPAAQPDAAAALLAVLDAPAVATPKSPEPQPTPTASLITAEPASVPGLVSGWLLDVPDMYGFAAEGTEHQIFEVDGRPVANRPEFDRVLRDTLATPDTSEVYIDIKTGASEGTATIETVAFPVKHRTVFPNGFVFETAWAEDAWQTTVFAVPVRGAREIAVGDLLVGDLTGNVKFDTRSSFPATVENAVLGGARVLTLAISRGGELTAASLPLPSAASR